MPLGNGNDRAETGTHYQGCDCISYPPEPKVAPRKVSHKLTFPRHRELCAHVHVMQLYASQQNEGMVYANYGKIHYMSSLSLKNIGA